MDNHVLANSAGHNLYQLSIIAAFGRKAQKPYKMAVLKIMATFILCLTLGIVLAPNIWRAKLPQNFPLWWFGGVLLIATTILVGLILLIISSTINQPQKACTLTKFINILPIKKLKKWHIKIAPLIIITLALSFFIYPVVIATAHAVNLGALPLLLIATLGLLTGLGAVLIPVPNWQLAIGLCTYLVLATKLLEKSLEISIRAQKVVVFSLSVATMGAFLGYYLSYRKTSFNNRSRHASKLATKFVQFIPVAWYLVKILRNPRTKSNYLVILIVILSLAVAVNLRHLGSGSQAGWVLFGTIMTAAFASDIRGISRRYKVPEINTAGSLMSFVSQQQVNTALLTTFACLPILILLHGSANQLSALIMQFLSLIFAANCIGLAVSTMFVAENGDTGGQFFSALSAMAVIFLLIKYLHLNDGSITHQFSGWISVGLGAFLLSYIIEHLRRQYANA